MRYWMAVGVVALVCSGLAWAADSLPKPQTKPGLWLLEKHTNLAIFIAPAATAADAAKRSEQALAGPGMKLQACLNPEEQQKHLDLASSMKGCVSGPVQAAGDTVTVDSVCQERKVHTVYSFSEPGHVLKAVSGTRSDGLPGTMMRMEARFDTPGHLAMEITTPAPGGQGVPLIEKWDFRWLSAECQGLAPGQFKPLMDKPDTGR